jgi:histidinol-phosphate aminotransferase
VDAVLEPVRAICADVRDRGAAAVLELSERFDGVRPQALRVPDEVIASALHGLEAAVLNALRESIRRARLVHESQRRAEVVTETASGGTVTQRWLPVDRVGLYVPGGQAVYPSSVVMNVVPAQVAGVASLVVASPPQREHGGWPHPAILAACALLGVDEVMAAGGAQAVALLAYGTSDDSGEEVRAVDMITGPGNIYVAAAKRVVEGIVGTDAEAGPTEIMIIADDLADPGLVAADLVSQAEHDRNAAAVLVTPSQSLAEAVMSELDLQVAATKHTDRVRAAIEGRQSAVVLVDDLDHALEVADAYAAEHLEIHTREARAVAERVRNAGAVFVGPWSPVSLGDYCAGSNHVLPTAGAAAHVGGLSVQTYLRSVQLIEYDVSALAATSSTVVTLAGAEDLPAHGAAVLARFDGQPPDEARDSPTAADRLPIRPELRARSAYGAPQLDVPVRLNTNENPHPPSSALVDDLTAEVRELARTLNRYPDRDALALRTDLAGYLSGRTGVPIDPEQIWAANGSNEVIQQILQLVGGAGRTALGFEPSYSMHRRIAEGTGTSYVSGARDEDFEIDVDQAVTTIERVRPDVVLLASPNNPTGTALSLETILAIHDAAVSARPSLVVVDEAYAEFARPGTPSAVTLLPGRPSLVVTRTLSKAFAMAGLRLGYLAADPAVVEAIQLVRLPYHLSAVTQAVARVALRHAGDLLATVGQVIEAREQLVAGVAGLGLRTVPSDANFVLVGGLADAHATWQRLVDRGVLVRDPGLPGWLRVTAGTRAEVKTFLAALAAVLHEERTPR